MSSSSPGFSALALLAIPLLLGGLSSPVEAKVFYSQREALELAFPGAERIEAKTHILRPDQVAQIERISRSRLATRLVTLYTAWRGSDLLGHAHIDVHTVRTKPEGFMVVLGPAGVVRSVRILAFHEPLDYLPTGRWYAGFTGRRGGDGLRVGRDVDAVSGATLSVRAATEGVRRALAYFQILLRQPAEAKD